jgi:hypothetical protein
MRTMLLVVWASSLDPLHVALGMSVGPGPLRPG